MNSEQYTTDKPYIVKALARQMLREHGIPENDFFHRFGYLPVYKTKDLLDWIGY